MSLVNKNVWLDADEEDDVITHSNRLQHHFKFLRKVRRKTRIKRIFGIVYSIEEIIKWT
jgi:hypothetical protein